MSELKPCPNCRSIILNDCYVYIQCNNCLMTGPQMNGGNYNDHADYLDHKAAVRAWNELPREKK